MNPAGAHVIKLDGAVLENRLFAKAMEAANKAGSFALDRARHHAPVRKIFKDTSRGRRTELFDRYASPAGVARQAVNRRVRTVDDTRDPATGFARPDRGRPNSMLPVFRNGNSLVTGDFRRVTIAGNKLTSERQDDGSVLHRVPFALAKVPYERSEIRNGRPVDVTDRVNRGTISGSTKLTAKGRFEVASGRANFRSPVDGKVRVGGRLRGQLYLSKAERIGDEVWAHVVSPTKDPDTGFPYNRAMEFGTVHNRPYPFLRPSLAETRPVLRRAARSAYKNARV